MKKVVRVGSQVGLEYLSTAIVAGDYLYVSGQGSIDPDSGEVVGDSIEEQTELTLKNLFDVLKCAQVKPENIIKINSYLNNIGNFDRYNAVYMKMMPAIKPARTTVGADLYPGMLIEIDCVAYLK